MELWGLSADTQSFRLRGALTVVVLSFWTLSKWSNNTCVERMVKVNVTSLWNWVSPFEQCQKRSYYLVDGLLDWPGKSWHIQLGETFAKDADLKKKIHIS